MTTSERFCPACGTAAGADEARFCMSCGHALAAEEPLLAGQPSPEQLPPEPAQPATGRRRSRLAWIVAGAVVVVLVLAGGAFVAVRQLTSERYDAASLRAVVERDNADYYSGTSKGARASYANIAPRCRAQNPEAEYVKSVTESARLMKGQEVVVKDVGVELYGSNRAIARTELAAPADAAYGQWPVTWVFEEGHWRFDICSDHADGSPWTTPGATLRNMSDVATGTCVTKLFFDPVRLPTPQIEVVDCGSPAAVARVGLTSDWTDDREQLYGTQPGENDFDTVFADLCTASAFGNFVGGLSPSPDSWTGQRKHVLCVYADQTPIEAGAPAFNTY